VLAGQLGEAHEGVEVGAVGRRHLGIEDGVEGEGDVPRGERLAVVPLHALLELERPGEAVLRHLPRLGEEGPDPELLVQLDQAVEHRPLRDVGLAVGRHHRVQAGGVAKVADHEVLPGGASRGRRRQHGGDGEAEGAHEAARHRRPPYHREGSAGSRASASPSPNRFRPRTVTKMATPGNVETHQAEPRNCRPSTTMLPQLGRGGWAPRPRYERPDSMRIVWPRSKVVWTTIAGSAFTRRWRTRIRRWLAPRARAASTN